MIKPPDLEHCNAFASRQASRFISQIYDSHLVKVGMTSAQFSIFTALVECPGTGIRELAETMVMDRTSLIRALKPLVRNGFVKALCLGVSSKKRSLVLTEAGMRQVELAVPHWHAASKEFESVLGSDFAAHLRQVLFASSRTAHENRSMTGPASQVGTYEEIY